MLSGGSTASDLVWSHGWDSCVGVRNIAGVGCGELSSLLCDVPVVCVCVCVCGGVRGCLLKNTICLDHTLMRDPEWSLQHSRRLLQATTGRIY